MQEIFDFCDIVRKRSDEHSEAMNRLTDIPGMMAPILRQELDSMVRTIFLLATKDLNERLRLVSQMLQGEEWTVIGKNGKKIKVTDRTMVDIAANISG